MNLPTVLPVALAICGLLSATPVAAVTYTVNVVFENYTRNSGNVESPVRLTGSITPIVFNGGSISGFDFDFRILSDDGVWDVQISSTTTPLLSSGFETFLATPTQLSFNPRGFFGTDFVSDVFGSDGVTGVGEKRETVQFQVGLDDSLDVLIAFALVSREIDTELVLVATGRSNPFVSTGTAFPSVLSTLPLPAALPLLATGMLALGALGWRRRRAG